MRVYSISTNCELSKCWRCVHTIILSCKSVVLIHASRGPAVRLLSQISHHQTKVEVRMWCYWSAWEPTLDNPCLCLQKPPKYKGVEPVWLSLESCRVLSWPSCCFTLLSNPDKNTNPGKTYIKILIIGLKYFISNLQLGYKMFISASLKNHILPIRLYQWFIGFHSNSAGVRWLAWCWLKVRNTWVNWAAVVFR